MLRGLKISANGNPKERGILTNKHIEDLEVTTENCWSVGNVCGGNREAAYVVKLICQEIGIPITYIFNKLGLFTVEFSECAYDGCTKNRVEGINMCYSHKKHCHIFTNSDVSVSKLDTLIHDLQIARAEAQAHLDAQAVSAIASVSEALAAQEAQAQAQAQALADQQAFHSMYNYFNQ